MNLVIRWILLLCLCFILALFPWPHFIAPMMPPWMLFLLFYTVVIWRASWAWFVLLFAGLMLDTMQVSVLGSHVLAFTLSLWVTRLDPKLYYNPAIDRQMIWVGAVCLVYQTTLFVLNAILYAGLAWQLMIQVGVSVMLSILLWPWVHLFLDATFKAKPVSRQMRILDHH